MTSNNSGLPDGGAYQGQSSSRPNGGNNGSGSRSFSTAAAEAFHAQSAASRTAVLAALGVQVAAGAGYNATSAAVVGQAAVHHLSNASASGVHAASGLSRLDLRQQQQQQQQHARYTSIPPSSVRAAVAVMNAGASGNDRVTQEQRSHRQSLAVQVQREALVAAAQQHQHASAVTAALRQHQQQQPLQTSRHATVAAHGYPIIRQQQQQVSAAAAAMSHGLVPSAHFGHHHRQPPPHQQPHTRHATNHIPSTTPSRESQQPSRQAVAARQQQEAQRRVATHTAAQITGQAPARQAAVQPARSEKEAEKQDRKPPSSSTTTSLESKLAHGQPEPEPVEADPDHDDQSETPQQIPPPPLRSRDHKTILEEKIIQQRSALVDKFAPFIAPSDRSMNDARKRLQKAHEQVQSLRAAFTERVYGKYRVCLRPPPTSAETLDAIRANPVAAAQRLEQEIERIRLEKEYEKKEAQALNVEFNKMDPSVLSSLHADNADQLMFISAGLSLVILPEEKNVDPKILEDYEDRGPVNPTTGQRVKNISQAAAAAGDVILERARKGAAMREQLLRRRTYDFIELGGSHTDVSRLDVPPDQYSPTDLLDVTMPLGVAVGKATGPAAPSDDSEHDDVGAHMQRSTAASPATLPQEQKPLAATTTTTSGAELQLNTSSSITAQNPSVGASAAKSAKRLAGKTSSGSLTNLQQLSSAKFGRSRGGAGISVNISLSLNPTADELTLDPEKPFRASTAALLTRCSGTAQGMNRSSPQQRLKHPHPESSGGRQRASSATSAKKELANLALAGAHPQSSPYLHSYLNLALPPLPTTLERRERKSLVVVDRRCSVRAKKAVQSVLRPFQDKRVSSSGPLTKIGVLHGIHKSRAARTSSGSESPAGDRPIDPSLAFSVLQAIGLMAEASGKLDNSPPPESLDKKVKMVAGGEKRKWMSLANLEDSWNRWGLAKKTRFSDAFKSKREPDRHAEASRNLPSDEGTESPAAENIRGGGELLSEANDDTPPSGASESDARKSNHRAGTGNLGYGNHATNVNSSSVANETRPSQPHWENPSRQSASGVNSQIGNSPIMGTNNPHVAVAAAAAQRHHQAHQHHQAQLPALNNDPYNHASNFNALQLAHQLRHATNNMAGLAAHSNHTQGELQVSNFFGGLHHSAPWSSIGSSAAAMAAAQSSLAALGLSVPMGVYNTVHDRAARALIAREQQNEAVAHAVAAHQQSMSNSSFVGGAANPGFAPTPSSMQHATRTALMNSSAQAYGAAMVQQSQGSMLSVSMAGQRDIGYRRNVSDAPGNSSQVRAQGNATSVTTQKRKAASLAENPKASPSLTSTSDDLQQDAHKKPKASEDDEFSLSVEKTSERKDVAVAANVAHMQTTTSALSAPPNATLGQILPSLSAKAAQSPNTPSQIAEPPKTKPPSSLVSPGQALQTENQPATPSLSFTPAPHQPFLSQPAAEGLSKAAPDQASRPQIEAGDAPLNGGLPCPPALKTPPVSDVQSLTDPTFGAALPLSDVEKSTEHSTVGTKVDLMFFEQAAPASLSPEQARLVQTGRVHEAFVAAAFKGGKTSEPSRPAGIIEFLTVVSAAVPIPKAIIAASLKDRLNIPGLKSLASNAGFNIQREVSEFHCCLERLRTIQLVDSPR
jgi:hypothetical protein